MLDEETLKYYCDIYLQAEALEEQAKYKELNSEQKSDCLNEASAIRTGRGYVPYEPLIRMVREAGYETIEDCYYGIKAADKNNEDGRGR